MLALALGLLPASALAGVEVREPARLTAGASDQFMGHLSPNGHDLYFVSTTNATAEVFRTDIRRGAPSLVFENDADVTSPQISPDGGRLLFVSYRSDALGDVCVRELAGGATTCLTGPGSAEVQAFWFPDGKAVGVVSRSAIHGDYQLLRIAADGGTPEVLLDRNLSSPAISPDGRWVAYVPIVRGSDAVGIHFAVRAAPQLDLVRLADGHTVTVRPELPGSSGFPAFTPDGRGLLFAQYLNDTNFDGVIDGNDHSVLFRLPFDGSAGEPIPDAVPAQLTSALWNCNYPAPASDRLIMTCSHEGSLDVYALSPDGAVDAAATPEELRGAVRVARNHWEKLLLLSRLLERAPEAERQDILRLMTRLHVELREYESAEFYAARVRAGASDVAWADAAAELVGHRREERRLVEGQISEDFLREQRERLSRIEGLVAQGGQAAELARLVASEIHDVMGEEQKALSWFDGVDRTALTDPFVLHAYAERARELLRPLGQRDRLLDALYALSIDEALTEAERVRYADHLVRELLRGRPRAERGALVDAFRARVDPDSAAAMLLELQGWLTRLGTDESEVVRKGVFELYRKTRDVDRRKALVLTTVAAAAAQDDSYVMYEFTNSWASWLKRKDPERAYAEALYENVVLERAYEELASGEIEAARGVFWGTTLQTDSLEAHIGFIEARIRTGNDDVRSIYAQRFEQTPDPALAHFVEAWLMARLVEAEPDDKTAATFAEGALERLRVVAEQRPRDLEVHHLWGTMAHELWARMGYRESALEAHAHYLIALDLARERPRYRAPILLQLGLLQSSLGNYRIALRYLRERTRLPFEDVGSRVAARVATARARLHGDRAERAAEEAEAALSDLSEPGAPVELRPLVLDLAALARYAAGDFDLAMRHYEELLPLQDEGAVAPINRIKTRIGLGAAAVAAGATDEGQEALSEAWALLEADSPLRPVTRPGQLDRRALRALVAGLRAAGYTRAGRPFEAELALEQRRAAVAELGDIPEALPDDAKASLDLAAVVWAQGRPEEAREHLERGLGAMDRYAVETGTPITVVGLRLLRSYAALHVYGRVEVDVSALRSRLRGALRFVSEHRNPEWEADRHLLEHYLAMLETLARVDRE